MSQPNLDVAYTANLARIELSQEEIDSFQDQLGKVLGYIEKLKSVDVSTVEPTAYAHPVYNVFREDEPRPGIPREEALANAPHAANGLVMITKVIES